MSDSEEKQNIVHFPAGEVIFTEKESGDFFYIIQSGEVQIYKINDEEIIPLDVIHTGQCLGEFAAFDGEARSACARALSDVKAVKIRSDAIRGEVKKLPNWMQAIVRSLVERLRHTNDIVQRNKTVDREILKKVHAAEFNVIKKD